MARHKISLAVLLIISIILLDSSSCSADQAQFLTAPWMVEIHKNSLLTGQGGISYHCAGVVLQGNAILTTMECIETLPDDSQLIMYAGTVTEWKHNDIQIFQPLRVNLHNYTKTAEIQIASVMNSKFVRVVSLCGGSDCNISRFGFQFGWTNEPPQKQYQSNRLQVIQFDFTNSFSLCQQIYENSTDKFCTQLDALQCNTNLGGEPLMKVDMGQTMLLGFWEYDDCAENIRVFRRWN